MARVLYVITIVAAVSIFALATRHVGAQADECVSNGAVPSGNDGLAQDCETLLDLKDTLRGSIALNWSSTLPITGWDGIRLGGSPKRVTIFKLQKRGLDGSIPAELGRLEKLKHIWLYVNQLTGPIPAELGGLADLETLMLSPERADTRGTGQPDAEAALADG